jgi:hypothetical protein
VLTLLSAGVMATMGHESPVLATVLAWVERLVLAGAPASLYLIAACGMGLAASRVLLRDGASLAVRCAIGVGLMLTLSHALGVVGALGGDKGPWVALLPVVLGLASFAGPLQRFFSRARSLPSLHPLWLVATPAAGVLLLAAASPPGWLWESEFRGYDALSYHLALPQEWLAVGSLRPFTHNVYSFLPSYIEAAFYHLGVLTHAAPAALSTPGVPGPLSVEPKWLLTGDGWRLLTCQYLHAGLTLFSVWWVADACAALLARFAPTLGARSIALGSAAAGAAVLATPWMIVVGSLAYNDAIAAGLLAAGVSALLPAAAGNAEPTATANDGTLWQSFRSSGQDETWRRFITRIAACAFICAVAASVKPTALLLAGPGVGLVLFLTTPPRRWLPALAAGCLVGLVCLSPWLTRNSWASGNPIFPFAAGLFPNAEGGTGHWSATQVATYAKGHAFSGTLGERLSLSLLPDHTDPAGSRHRGLMHPQWWALFPCAFAACLGLLASARMRATGVLSFTLLLLGLIAWLGLTHVQSRFLVPLVVFAALPIGAACAALHHRGAAGSRIAAAFACSVVLAQAAGSVWIFMRQHGGRPNELILAGPSLRSGEAFRLALSQAPREEAAAFMREAAPEMFCNLFLPAEATLSIVGGATPLYFTRNVRYNTTWDRWPIAEVLDSWKAGALHDAARTLASRYVLIDLGEINRLHASGWAPEGVDPATVSEWMQQRTELIQPWPRAGIFLVRLLEDTPPKGSHQ